MFNREKIGRSMTPVSASEMKLLGGGKVPKHEFVERFVGERHPDVVGFPFHFSLPFLPCIERGLEPDPSGRYVSAF